MLKRLYFSASWSGWLVPCWFTELRGMLSLLLLFGALYHPLEITDWRMLWSVGGNAKQFHLITIWKPFPLHCIGRRIHLFATREVLSFRMTRLMIEVDVVDILATENFKSTEHYHRNGQTLALAEHDCYTFTGLFTGLEDNGVLLCCTKIIIYCWVANCYNMVDRSLDIQMYNTSY